MRRATRTTRFPLRHRPEDIQRSALAGDAPALARTLRYTRSQDEAWAAHYALVRLGAEAVSPLLAFLRDDPTRRSQRAWWTLMRIGEPAQAALADCLRRSPMAEARAAAAWILGHIGGQAADRHLVRALDDPEGAVVLPAALMLGFRECRQAVPSLLRVLTGGEYDDPAAPHPDQLALALPGIEVYGEVLPDDCLESAAGSPESSRPPACGFEALVEPLERSVADDLADFLVWGSETLPEGEDAVWESSDDFTPAWVISPWCYWSPEDLREAAAISLGRIADARSVAVLAQCAANESEPDSLRRLAIEALGHIGDASGFDVVYDALSDEELADEALNALGGFIDRRALRPLARAAFGQGVGRIDAVSGLSVYENQAAVPHLLRLAADADDYIAAQAVRGLARIGTQIALEAVVARLSDSDPATRRQAAAALGWAQRRRAAGAAVDHGETIWHP